jgi:hypothetical protein
MDATPPPLERQVSRETRGRSAPGRSGPSAGTRDCWPGLRAWCRSDLAGGEGRQQALLGAEPLGQRRRRQPDPPGDLGRRQPAAITTTEISTLAEKRGGIRSVFIDTPGLWLSIPCRTGHSVRPWPITCIATGRRSHVMSAGAQGNQARHDEGIRLRFLRISIAGCAGSDRFLRVCPDPLLA